MAEADFESYCNTGQYKMFLPSHRSSTLKSIIFCFLKISTCIHVTMTMMARFLVTYKIGGTSTELG